MQTKEVTHQLRGGWVKKQQSNDIEGRRMTSTCKLMILAILSLTLKTNWSVICKSHFKSLNYGPWLKSCDPTTGFYHDIIYIICTHFSINVWKRLRYCTKVSIPWIPKKIPSWPFILDGLTMAVAPPLPPFPLAHTHARWRCWKGRVKAISCLSFCQ